MVMLQQKIRWLILFSILLPFFSYSLVSAVTVGSGISIVQSNITVLYDEFNQSINTTNFSAIDDVQLSNIINMTLENETHGIIIWSDPVDLTLVTDNSIVDLDTYIEIDYNSLFIDTSYFTNLAGDARLAFYNISFTDPEILRNGNPCGSGCSIISYENDTLFFDSTALTSSESSNFSVREFQEEEEEEEDDGDGGSGGGGGGGGATTPIGNLTNFSVSPSLLELSLHAGETVTELITIENTGNHDFSISVDIQGIDEFTSVSQTEFFLESGESQDIIATFTIPTEADSDLRTGSIIFVSEDVSIPAFVVLDIIDVVPLFDLASTLEDITVTIRQKLDATIQMTDISGLGPVDVTLEYFIKDFGDNTTKLGEETITVDGFLEIERSFPVPNELLVGDYVFHSKLSYLDSVATSANTFKIISVRFIFNLFIFGLLFLIVLFGFLIFFVWRREEERNKIKGLLDKIKKGRILRKAEERKSTKLIPSIK